MTRLIFDLLVDRLPDGQARSAIAELRDDNVMMLDLRVPAQDLVVRTIVDHLPVHLETLDVDVRASLLPGFTRLLELATDQHHRNQATSDEMGVARDGHWQDLREVNTGSPSDLEQFFGAYFHQDWVLEADDWRGIVDRYSKSPTRTPQHLRALAADIDQLRRDHPASEVHTALMDMGAFYDPRPEMTYREWLTHVAERLRQRAADVD